MSLKSPEQKSGHLVLPGERLGVIEEFIPDSGTFVKDGVIFSKIIGRSLMDLQTRRVSVYPMVDRVVVPKVSTVVIGQIGNAQSDNVLVKIFRIGNKTLSGNFGGIEGWFPYVMALFFLLVRPEGLFGEKHIDRV